MVKTLETMTSAGLGVFLVAGTGRVAIAKSSDRPRVKVLERGLIDFAQAHIRFNCCSL